MAKARTDSMVWSLAVSGRTISTSAHHGRRVEEVQPAHPIRPLRLHGQLDDRERRGVGGEDGLGLDDLFELARTAPS